MMAASQRSVLPMQFASLRSDSSHPWMYGIKLGFDAVCLLGMPGGGGGTTKAKLERMGEPVLGRGKDT